MITENRMNDLLGPQPYPELGALLRRRSNEILKRWTGEVRELLPKARALSDDRLRNSIPLLLDEMANTLQYLGPTGAPRLSEMANSHGGIRHRQGYDQEELFAEYRLLRRILIEALHDELSGERAVEKVVALNMCMDAILQSGAIYFAEGVRERETAEVSRDAKHLSFLAHDLRNRLNHISVILKVLSKKLEFEDERALIDTANRSIIDTIQGMDKVLQAERAQSKNRVKDEVHLRELTWKVAADHSPTAKDKRLDIAIHIPAEAVVYSDPQLIAICLNNLIGNAVKFSEKGLIRIEAAPAARDGRSGWEMSVSDEGPGIAEDKRALLFQVFSRGESHGQTGMGLGLAITAHTAKLLGTEIELESKEGIGSTFRFFLSCR